MANLLLIVLYLVVLLITFRQNCKQHCKIGELQQGMKLEKDRADCFLRLSRLREEQIRLLRAAQVEDAPDAARYRAWRTAICEERWDVLDVMEKYVTDKGIDPPTVPFVDEAADLAIATLRASKVGA